MLEIRDIHKSYGKREILKGINLTANPGEMIAIAGLNGCGKSTLLSILAGTQACDSGAFIINGIDVIDAPSKRKGLIGYVPQENPLIPELSVYDNLKLWYCDSKLDLDEELKTGVLKLLGIDEFVKMKVSKLSGGMKKRVSIGIAVAHDPAILILDEPSAALDLYCKENIKAYLEEHLKRKGIVLITTHDEAELDMCNKLMIMKDGVFTEADISLRGASLLSRLSGE